MWHAQFDKRLESWNHLRNSANSLSLEDSLQLINEWWHQTPWCPYHLHWDDRETWPDPWQLLSDNVYCDLARALGIMYTVVLMDRSDLSSSSIVETDQGNLVQIDQAKYILNWGRNIVLNTSLEQHKITNAVDYNSIQLQLL